MSNQESCDRIWRSLCVVFWLTFIVVLHAIAWTVHDIGDTLDAMYNLLLKWKP